MQINNERIDELFFQKIGNMEVVPPENGWQRIQHELDSQKRFAFKFWMAAASIALLMSSVATIMYLNTSELAGTMVLVEQNPQTPPTVNSVEEQPLATAAATPQVVENQVTQITPSTQTPKNITTNSKTPVYWNTSTHRAQRQALNNERLAILIDRFAAKPAAMPLEKNRPVIMASTLPMYNNDWNPFAEEEKEKGKAPSKNKWAVSGQFSPTYSYRTITSVPANMKRADFDDAESALLAYSGGVNVSYQVLSRFSVQMGVFYTQMGQTINGVTPSYNMYAAISSNNAYSKNSLRTSSGNASVTSSMKADVNESYANYFNENTVQGSLNTSNTAKSVQYSERFDYIEIPMLMRYKLIDKKFDLALLGGMSTNILIDNNVFINNGKETLREGSILMARPVNYNTTIGFGVNYQLSSTLLIGIEPVFKYFLQSYTSSNAVGSHPYSFGVFTGVYYSF
ncbi:MAG: outer membrane beta-barrel protein [Bacteroidales bacterium]|jgi:hypothetical protein|nr:outer membrane beta-barrel protein [Bacteroidales bacterium]